jgi:hypothetical protein
MLATVVSTFVAFMVTVGVVQGVAMPVGEYAIEKGTDAYVAGKEMIIGTEAD